MADRFPFMRMYKDVASRLSDEDRLEFYDILLDYALDDVEPDGKGVSVAVFEAVRTVVDNWKTKRDNGTKGGRPKANDNQTKTKTKPNYNQTETKVEKYKSIKDKKRENIKREKAREILDIYNEICTSLPRANDVTDQRAECVNALLEKHSKEDIRAVFTRAESSSFLTGKKTDFQANFNWLINEENYVKVSEGNYDDKHENRERIEAGRRAQLEAEARIEAEHKAEIEKLKRDNPEEWERLTEKSRHIHSIEEVLKNELR